MAAKKHEFTSPLGRMLCDCLLIYIIQCSYLSSESTCGIVCFLNVVVCVIMQNATLRNAGQEEAFVNNSAQKLLNIYNSLCVKGSTLVS